MGRIEVVGAASTRELRDRLPELLAPFADVFPKDRAARVLLKPNLNANMNALTGNTTDLRLLAAVVLYLKELGYADITIGEGTNSGFYRNKIGVISRLMVDALAERLGVRVLDLNYEDTVDVPFEDGPAGVARVCVEADLFINLPVLKTHFEAGMTVCLKNLMGCLVGQENKKKTHQSLAANIVNLNLALRPHLHIVDALVAMEGLGPTRGTPVPMNMVLAGDDPFCLDMACAGIARFPQRDVKPLAEAERRGLLTPERRAAAEAFVPPATRKFAPPKAGFPASFIHHPDRQKYFLAVRNTPFFTWLAGTKWFGHVLFRTGLRQDVFCKEDMRFKGLTFDPDACGDCGACRAYCPMDLDPTRNLAPKHPDCIDCLYCFMVCPQKAFAFHGELGFLREQLRRYDDLARGLFAAGRDP